MASREAFCLLLSLGSRGLSRLTPIALGDKPKPYSPPSVDRIWFWVNYSKIPIYPILYLLKGD